MHRSVSAVLAVCGLLRTPAVHAQDTTPSPITSPTPSTTSVTAPAPTSPATHRPLATDYPFNPTAGVPLPPRPAPPAHWAHTTALGASVGLGAPYGYAGAFLTHNPTPWLQLEIGGGYSVPFGPSVGFMARAGLDPGNDSRVSLGLGASANFSDYRYVTNCRYTTTTTGSDLEDCTPTGDRRTAAGTAYPLWINLEIAADLRTLSDFGARAAVGASVLLNATAFPDALGCPSDPTGHVPCTAAFAHSEGRVFFQFYAHFDVYFLLYNGVESGRPQPALPRGAEVIATPPAPASVPASVPASAPVPAR